MLRVCFDCYDIYTTDSVYQWDLNHSLEISGLPVGSTVTIHFCNKKSTEAIVTKTTVKGTTFTAPVPNELLQEPYNLIAYVHVYANNQAKTIEVVNIPLIKRVKPTDYQFVDNVDVMNFTRLEKDMSDFIAECEALIQEIKNETVSLDGGYPDSVY